MCLCGGRTLYIIHIDGKRLTISLPHVPKPEYIFLSIICTILKKNIHFPNGLSNGLWLTSCSPSTSLFLKSVIAVGAWMLWKSRCNLVFNDEAPDLNLGLIWIGLREKCFFFNLVGFFKKVFFRVS